MTGLAGITWLLYSSFFGEKVTFVNESIQYQLPVLIGVVIVKMIILYANNFRTSKKLFVNYCV